MVGVVVVGMVLVGAGWCWCWLVLLGYLHRDSNLKPSLIIVLACKQGEHYSDIIF